MKEDPFVPTAEAAFIAGITDKEMNRAVDEHILREPLIRSANGRLFARLGAALASFYFKTDQIYVASFRRRVLEEVMLRIQRSAVDHVEAICALREVPKEGWRIKVEPGESLTITPSPGEIQLRTGVVLVDVDLDSFVVDASRRMKEIERVEDLIRSDSEIMGGAPVFAGTRVLIDSVVASLEKGIDPKRILQAYPSLTEEHLNAARVYVSVHPKRGRPSKALSTPASWKVKTNRRVPRIRKDP